MGSSNLESAMVTAFVQPNHWWMGRLVMLLGVPGVVLGSWGWGWMGDRALAQMPLSEMAPLYPPDAPPARRAPLPDQRQQIEEQTVGVDRRVSALQLDSRNRSLWVGSWQGLAKLNPSTGQILDRVSLPNQTVGAITQDKSGRIWVGTYAGLSRVDPKTGIITAQNFALPSNQVLDLLIDQRGYLWVGTDAGLALISPDKGFLMTTIKNLPGVSANALALDPLGNLWVGTLDGLVEIDTAKATIKRRIANLPGVMVQALSVSPWNTLWIGTPTGLLEANLGIKRVVQTVPATTPPKASRSGNAKPPTKAKQPQKNASATKKQVRRRVVFLPSATPMFELRSLSQVQGRNITALHFDSINSVWVGTTTGLLRVNPFNGATGGEIANLPSSRIFSLSPDTGGKLWVGTSEGLAWVNTQTFKGRVHQTFRSVDRD
ncbi:MAG: two-component regulator propeller domain-containing protein [Leptolyngbyaceae cyanobacterium bins.302]|nr:two-component regulator propeller domain-containing protein [Leptolyngbyaceae cyanobacterium bins.302]